MTPPKNSLEKASQFFSDLQDDVLNLASKLGSVGLIPGLPLPITSLPLIEIPAASGESVVEFKNCGNEQIPVPCVMIDIGKLLGFGAGKHAGKAFARNLTSELLKTVPPPAGSGFGDLIRYVQGMIQSIVEYFKDESLAASVAQQFAILSGSLGASAISSGIGAALGGMAGSAVGKALSAGKPATPAQPKPVPAGAPDR